MILLCNLVYTGDDDIDLCDLLSVSNQSFM